MVVMLLCSLLHGFMEYVQLSRLQFTGLGLQCGFLMKGGSFCWL